MFTKTATILLALLSALLVPSPATAEENSRLEQVHEVAKPYLRPAGAPGASEVCFSSRSKHPRNVNDPHDTFATARAFDITRYVWIYTEDAAFIQEAKKTATSFQCTLNSMVTDQPEGGRKRGRIMDLDGNLVSEDVALTRRVIATSYASGGHLLVPWDVYMGNTPSGVRRYYGDPADYADLYRFVRNNSALYNRYEDGAFAITGEQDKRYPTRVPVSLRGADQASAFVRAVPGDGKQPIVIHLVDWSESPKPFEVHLEPERFAGIGEMSATLLRPAVEPSRLTITRAKEKLVLEIPPLSPWAIIRLDREKL